MRDRRGEPFEDPGLRVLMCLVPNDVPGGHKIQLEKTAQALQALGATVDVVEGRTAAAGEFDIVHGLGLTAADVRSFRQQRKPVALSSIYASYRYALGLDGPGAIGADLVRRTRVGGGLALSAFRLRHVPKMELALTRQTEHRLAFECADLLLPNANGEEAAIRAELGVSTPTHVVPNGVDAELFQPPDGSTKRSGVLYVGRMDRWKNQLGLIRALGGTGIPLTLVGPVHPHHNDYLAECRAAADSNVEFVLDVPHEQLPDYYRRAAVHVLPSWYETTGLVSLEAALCGCRIVSTSRGHAHEYLGEDAWYCDPARPRTIREAVVAALQGPEQPHLRERILARYTWDHVAKATLEGYRAALGAVPSMG